MTDALLDLQDQLFTDWEAIAMNDCSPDDSLAVAQRFADADSRIRIVSHEENRGLSAARNTGLAAAYGRYVWFPDPDDRYDFTLLQSVYDSLQQPGNAGGYGEACGRILRCCWRIQVRRRVPARAEKRSYGQN